MSHQTTEDAEDDEFEFYIIHDSVGVSHVMRKRKGEPPMFRRTTSFD